MARRGEHFDSALEPDMDPHVVDDLRRGRDGAHPTRHPRRHRGIEQVREERDEREAQMVLASDRLGFLVGAVALSLIVVIQTLRHQNTFLCSKACRCCLGKTVRWNPFSFSAT